MEDKTFAGIEELALERVAIRRVGASWLLAEDCMVGLVSMHKSVVAVDGLAVVYPCAAAVQDSSLCDADGKYGRRVGIHSVAAESVRVGGMVSRRYR